MGILKRIEVKELKGTKRTFLLENWNGKPPENPLKTRKNLIYFFIAPERPLISFWGSYLPCKEKL